MAANRLMRFAGIGGIVAPEKAPRRERLSARKSPRRERHGHQELRGDNKVIRSFRATSQSITSFVALKKSLRSFSGLEKADGGWSCDSPPPASSNCLQGKIGPRLGARRGASL